MIQGVSEEYAPLPQRGGSSLSIKVDTNPEGDHLLTPPSQNGEAAHEHQRSPEAEHQFLRKRMKALSMLALLLISGYVVSIYYKNDSSDRCRKRCEEEDDPDSCFDGCSKLGWALSTSALIVLSLLGVLPLLCCCGTWYARMRRLKERLAALAPNQGQQRGSINISVDGNNANGLGSATKEKFFGNNNQSNLSLQLQSSSQPGSAIQSPLEGPPPRLFGGPGKGGSVAQSPIPESSATNAATPVPTNNNNASASSFSIAVTRPPAVVAGTQQHHRHNHSGSQTSQSGGHHSQSASVDLGQLQMQVLNTNTPQTSSTVNLIPQNVARSSITLDSAPLAANGRPNSNSAVSALKSAA